jgi:arabinose-5-phosphate isomerase
MLIKELLDKEREALTHFFDHLDQEALETLLKQLHECKGLIFLTGVGKSALVAEKIAMTMTSTGSRAFYLSPASALHGDIGMVRGQDIFIMLSKSGESDELLNLIPYVRNKGCKIAAVVTQANSRLAKASDLVVTLPLERELCPFDLAPTTSTVIQMIVGDLLAIGLMRLKNVTIDEYALNHPAGRIGRRIFTKVKHLMIQGEGIPLAGPTDHLVDVLVELSNKRCGCVLVTDPQRHLLGIFTDGDLRRALQSRGPAALDSPMETLMTKTARSIGESELAWTALQLMEADQKSPITVLAVLNDSRQVTGVIKMHDIVQSGL